jgi:hypothetical protein
MRKLLIVVWIIALVLAFTHSAFSSTLAQKQATFASAVGRLIAQANSKGFEVTLGEAWRTPEQAVFRTMWDAQHGKGIANSLHLLRLAIDLNLFKGGKYLAKSEDYKELGEWWEAQSSKEFRFCWGGRFKRTDGNHFSLEHQGIQ